MDLLNNLEQWQFYLLLIGIAAVITSIRWLVFRPKGTKQEMTGHATVVSKRAKLGKVAAKYASSYDYMVTFDLGNLELELYVTQHHFQALKEVMTGHLLWHYENLIAFEPDNP